MLPYKLIGVIASAMAVIFFDLLRIRRSLTISNIKKAYPDRSSLELASIGRRSYRHFFLTLLESFKSYNTQYISGVELVGGENLHKALDEGRGAFILISHFGNWELMGGAIATIFAPVHALVKEIGNEGTNKFVTELRENIGVVCVERKNKLDGVKGVKRALEKGHIVAFMVDQARGGEPRVPFFGEPALTNSGLAPLSQRFRAPVIPVRMERIEAGRHRLVCYEPVVFKVDEKAEKDKLRLDHTILTNKIVENMIKECPEQYFWVHNRWK